MKNPPLVELHDVAKRYGHQVVFSGLTFTMREPEILGVIGPNGSGKTTLLRLLLGLVRPDQGGDGAVLMRGSRPTVALMRLPVAYFGGASTLAAAPTAGQWARLFNLDPAVVCETRSLRALSRGTRQIVGLRSALARPDTLLILLDEPWEGLDPDGSRWLSDALRRKRAAGVSVIVSSHRLSDLAGVCDRYGFLAGGAMTCMTAEQVQPHGPVTAEALLKVFDNLRSRPA